MDASLSERLGFPAEITGVDLAQALDATRFRDIERRFDASGVAIFRSQSLTPAQHVAFSRRFGTLEVHFLEQFLLPGHPEVLVVSNVVEDGRPIGQADAGRAWHSDMSYVAAPSRCSLLLAREVPEEAGAALGDTLFADAAAAYDALPAAMQRRLDGLQAVHQFGTRYRAKAEGQSGTLALSDDQKRRTPPVVHPVVRRHPATGRKCLYVNECFTSEIVGLPEDESRALLQELFAHVIRPEFVYRHRWRVGDLVMWDNCTVQHRAVQDYGTRRRLMHRTTVAGVPTA